MTETKPTMLRIKDAAALLCMSVTQLRRQARENKVPHLRGVKFYLFDQDELLTWAKRHETDGTSDRDATQNNDVSPHTTTTKKPTNYRATLKAIAAEPPPQGESCD